MSIGTRSEPFTFMNNYKDINMMEVKKERCPECLFSKDKIVSNSRRKDLLEECERNDTHFVCHKSSINGGEACCKGFYDTYSTNMLRISQRLRMIEFID
jgi:hypothetical protein